MISSGRHFSHRRSAPKNAQRFVQVAPTDRAHGLLGGFRNLIVVMGALCFFAQFLIAPYMENLLSACICFFAGAALFCFQFRPAQIAAFPISGMMVTLPSLTTLLFPLIFTTFEGKAVTFNLMEPVTTFSVAALCASILVIAHYIYRRTRFIHGFQQAFREKILTPIGCFQAPSAAQLWIMGGIGLVALTFVFVVLPSRGMMREGTVIKLVEAFMPYAYAPFILLMPKLYGQQTKADPLQFPFIAGYFLLLLVFAIAGNYRFAFAIAMMMPLLCYILGLITGRLPAPKATGPMLAIGLAIGVVVFVLVSNLALAMQIARVNRGDVSGSEMVRITMGILSNSQEIAEYKQNLYDDEFAGSSYSEYYIANPLISRFVLTKFHDNGHYYRKQMGAGQQALFRDFLKKRFLAQIPGPILKAFGVGFQKEEVLGMSFGDWFLMNATDVRHTGFRTGSYQAGGLLAFGWVFPVVLGFMAIALFTLLDCFVRWAPPNEGRSNFVLSVAPVGLIFIYSLVFFADRESLSDWAGYMIRFFPQTLAFYVLLAVGTSFFAGGGAKRA